MSAERVELLVGRIGRAHGIRGDVVIDVRTDEPDERFADGTRFATARGDLTVRSSRWHSGRLLVTFAEITDRSLAEAWRGTDLLVEVAVEARPDDPDEYYDHQLVGLTAHTPDGAVVGQVGELLHLPGQDTLLVRRPDGGEVLVPFVSALVPEVDLAAKRVVVIDQPGLLRDFEDGPDADRQSPG